MSVVKRIRGWTAATTFLLGVLSAGWVQADQSLVQHLGTLDVPGTYHYGRSIVDGNAVLGGGESIHDQITFAVASPADAANGVISASVGGNGFASFATSLWNVTSDVLLITGPTTSLGTGSWASFFEFSPLLTSTGYSIHVDAVTLAGSQFAGYGGSLILAQPIPEPETYAMLLAGLSLMGLVARRRKKARAA